jgi:hypothetical protein
MRALAKICLILSLTLLATLAFAQVEPPARVGRISIVEGALAFYGPGDNDWSAAKVNFPVAENGWFATDSNSRAEFRIGADSAFLANNSEAGFTRLRQKDMQLALQQGRVALHLRQLNSGSNAEVDIGRGGIWLLQRGEYDIDGGDADRPTRIAVFDGSARFVGGGVDITVKAGDALVLSGADTLSATVEPATADEFARWCRAHDYHERRLAAPYHVSPAMTGFEELDSYGAWTRDADYGEVWFPKSVPADWAPYRAGHWVWIEPWGWNWVDDEPWGFAPCHYGRWARIHGRWGWVPGEFVPEPVYAPALVAFIPPPAIEVAVPAALGPPVGWFPLGPGEIYWPSYTRDPTYIRNVNITNVNVTVINKITQIAASDRTAAPPPVVANQTFANRSAATVVPAAVMTTADNVAPAAIKLSPQALQKASVSVHPPQVVALPVAVTKPAANAATAPPERSAKSPASGQTTAPAAPNALSATPPATPGAKSAGGPPVRPNFSQLAPAPQLARAMAQTATQTTTPAAGPHSAGTPEQHQGEATAAIPPAGTHSAGPPQPRPGEAGAVIPPPSTARAGERQQQPAQKTTGPALAAHPAEQQPTQATVAPPAPGRPPGPPDFSRLAPPRGVHPGQPGHATTSATAGSQPSPGLRPVGQSETKAATPGPVQSPGAPQAAPHEAAPPAQAPGLARREPANHPGAARTAGEPAPPPNPAVPPPHAASLPAAKELVPQRAEQQELLRQQAQQRAAAEAAARQQAQQRAAVDAAAQQQRAAAEAAARQQAQQRAAAETIARQQAQQRAAAEAIARQQAQQRAAADAAAQQQRAAAEAAARQQAQQRAAAEAIARQQAQQRAAADAAARAQAQQAAVQQHAVAPHACGHPGEPPCPK